MILEEVKNQIKQILEVEDFVVAFNEIKNIEKFGHVYTNVAMRLKVDAEGVAEKLRNSFPKVEVAGNGFINIWLEENFLRAHIVVKDKIKTKFTDKKILVEHSSPNLFKPFHIGHLMNNIVGEFVVRAMKVGGAEVKAMSFPSDVSLGIAKAIFIVQEDKKDLDFFNGVQMDVINYLGEAYTRGVKYFEEHSEEIEKAKYINRILNYQQGESRLGTNVDLYLDQLHSTVRDLNMIVFKKFLEEKLGSKIDNYIFESESGVLGKIIVEENIPKVFSESEGAVVYIPSEERKDIHTSVFINSDSIPTYEAKDLGLLGLKFVSEFNTENNFTPEKSFFITDNEQINHFKSVFAAAIDIGGVWIDRVEISQHVPHGRMTFKGEKMSSRLGGVPLALDTINVVIDEVKEKSGDRLAHLSDTEKEKVYFDIALSALRISILRAKPGSNINFDPETSLSFEGDSGPYLEYTHARCSSLLSKGRESDATPKLNESISITTLEIKLAQFSDILKVSIEEIAPQKLVTYLFELAQEFNSYYANNQIIVEGDSVTEHRLYIVEQTKGILKIGLHILGINAVERM